MTVSSIEQPPNRLGRILKWIGGTFLVALVLVVAFFCYGIYLQRNNPLNLLQSSTSNAPITFSIDGRMLRIPKNYFLIAPGPPNIDGVINFALLVQLPNFEPRTKDNQAEFDATGWGRKVNIFVMVRPTKPEDITHANKLNIQDAYHTITDNQYFHGDKSIKDGPFGYKFFSDEGDQEYLFKGTFENPTFTLICKSQHHVHEDIDPDHWSPDCERNLQIGPNTRLQYTLSRNYLEQIQKIEPQLLAFLNSFIVQGPNFEVIE